MSNSSFTGVYNEDSLNRIAASSADIGSLKAGSIVCDSVQISVPKVAIIKPTASATNYTLSPENLSLMARGDVLYGGSGATLRLQINSVDTAAEALRLLSLFNITDANTTRLIKFSRVTAISNHTISIGTLNTLSTFKYVMYSSEGASAAAVQELSEVNSHRDAYVLIYSGLVAGTTEKTIIFDVIAKALTL